MRGITGGTIYSHVWRYQKPISLRKEDAKKLWLNKRLSSLCLHSFFISEQESSTSPPLNCQKHCGLIFFKGSLRSLFCIMWWKSAIFSYISLGKVEMVENELLLIGVRMSEKLIRKQRCLQDILQGLGGKGRDGSWAAQLSQLCSAVHHCATHRCSHSPWQCSPSPFPLQREGPHSWHQSPVRLHICSYLFPFLYLLCLSSPEQAARSSFALLGSCHRTLIYSVLHVSCCCYFCDHSFDLRFPSASGNSFWPRCSFGWSSFWTFCEL